MPRERWFSDAEYQRRLALVRHAMHQRDLDGLLVFSPAAVYWLTGHHSIDSWEFRAALITPDRDPMLLLYQFERGRFLVSSWLENATWYGAGHPPMPVLAEMIREAKLARGRIGIEAHTSFNAEDRKQLIGELPGARLTDCGRLVDELRVVKSDEELSCVHKAADLTNVGVAAARDAIGEGVADYEIVAACSAAMYQAGSHHFVMPPTVAMGYRSGLSHSEHAGAILRRNQSIFIELSGCWRHYSAPLMYTQYLWDPPPLWRQCLTAAHDIARTIISVARPGVRASEVAAAALEALRPVEPLIQFHYNFGYSIGASFPPHWLEESGFYLKADNHRELQEGMVFHLPLTLRILGEFAAGTSRTIQITRDGCRALTGYAE